jgi:dolichol-phosphate mannosyltransferase
MLLALAALLEGLAGGRAVLRMLATAGGTSLAGGSAAAGALTVIVPVLDEQDRVGAALAALAATGPELRAIVVVDGGSRDGTAAVVAAAAARDPRVRWHDAGPPEPGWNGKAWNLDAGLRLAATPYVATVDADARVGPRLLAAAVARLDADDLAALSVATRQELADLGSGLLHPAFLTTLVYRAGLPNVALADPRRVQANGQVFVARRATLLAADAFGAARASRCEDVTVARTLAARGGRIGFYEGDAVVRMYASWRDCAANWPRSLTLRDRFVTAAQSWWSILELLFAQALPLPTLIVLLVLREHIAYAPPATALATALVATRLGVLVGTRRAYVRPPWTYWLSPLADLPAVALLAASALRRRHTWRGRTLVEEPA